MYWTEIDTFKLSEFDAMYNIKTNFLEYGAFFINIINYSGWKDVAEGTTVYPCNSYLNVLLSRDRKAVSCTLSNRWEEMRMLFQKPVRNGLKRQQTE